MGVSVSIGRKEARQVATAGADCVLHEYNTIGCSSLYEIM